jgi:hypothetical protein
MNSKEKELIAEFLRVFFDNIDETDTKLVYLNPDPIKDLFQKYFPKYKISEDNLDSLLISFITKYQDILKIYDITVSPTWLPYYKGKHILV